MEKKAENIVQNIGAIAETTSVFYNAISKQVPKDVALILTQHFMDLTITKRPNINPAAAAAAAAARIEEERRRAAARQKKQEAAQNRAQNETGAAPAGNGQELPRGAEKPEKPEKPEMPEMPEKPEKPENFAESGEI